MPELLQNPVILTLSLLSLSLLALYIREYSRRSKLSKNGNQELGEYKEKGLNLLYQSMKESQTILGQAELDGLKAVAEGKFSAQKLEENYSAKLDEIIRQSQVSITDAQGKVTQYMQSLEGLGQEKINELFGKLEQRLSDFLVSTEQKTTYSIELELKSARQLIETYKNEQLKLIDENIMSMMEQTLSLVLSKKLTLKDQLDLVYEALEKAKVEKFIV